MPIHSIFTTLLCAASLTSAGAAEAPIALPDFASYQRTAAGAPILPIQPPVFTVSAMIDDQPFSEQVPVDAAFQMTSFVALTTFSPIATELAIPSQDIDELLAANRSICDLAGGRVAHRLDNRGAIRETPVVKVWANYMRASKRSGTHMCLDSQERLLYELTISPAGDAPSTLLPLGFAWPINIYVFDGRHYRDLEQHLSAYHRRIEGLRANAQVGTRIGVARSKLPAKFPDGGWPGGQYTCALIIGRQGPLVQVQIRTFQLYVALEAIFPLGQVDGDVPKARRPSQSDCAP